MKNLIFVLILVISSIQAKSQSISIFDIEATNFPTMKAKFYAFDKDGKPTTPNISDLQLTENGINRTITNVSCPVPKVSTLSVGIMVDTYSKIDLARKGVQKLIDYLYLPQDEIGITYMAKGVYIYQDFTKNKQKVSASAALIPSAPGVDINAMFYSQYTGGIPFIKDRQSDKKILILVSDLHCPNLNINEAQLIADAKANNISIYSVLLGSNDYTGLFSRIAKGTDGVVFERVSDENQITNIFQEIERIERNEPCDISWIGDVTCDPLTTIVELKWQNLKSITTYIPKFNSVAKLKVSNNFIAFGRKLPSTQNDTIITLTAQNSDFTITGINRKFGSTDFTIDNSIFPLFIPNNTSKDIRIRFEPNDSSIKYASFEIVTDKCVAYFSSSGGFYFDNSNNITLKLTKPNGGETFVAGSDTLITWDGISPTDTVTLEYSIDKGTNWKLISNKATNLKYNWNNIPLPKSQQCLVKVFQNLNGKSDLDSILFFKGHTGRISSIDFDFTGSKLATASFDSTAKIWDAHTGLVDITLKGHTARIFDIAFSKDASKVATAGEDKIAKIWDLNTGLTIKSLVGHSGPLLSICYSFDGTQLATASTDKTIRIWDTNTGLAIKTLSGHNGNVEGISFNPNGTQIASISNDFTAKIWDLQTGIVQLTINASTGGFTNIAFSPDGSKVATSCIDKTVKIWDIKTGIEIISLIGHTNIVFDVDFSPDGSYIVTSSDQSVIIWDTKNGKIIKTLRRDNYIFNKVAYCSDSKRIAIACWDSTAMVWDLETQPLQQDISDSVFSIIAPQANFNKLNIDMGKVVLGQNKDTLVTSVFCNIGEAPLHVMGVDVTNGNVGDFMMPRGAGEFYLPPNECRDLMFDFMPTQLGKRNAKITVKSTMQDFIDTIKITGEGIAPQLEIVNNLIDFGFVDVGSFKDTIQVLTIKNIGTAALNINNSLHLGPNDFDFTTLSGSAPFILNAGESAKMNLRFAPTSTGRTSGRLQFEFNGAGSPATVQLFGTGISSRALIKVGSDTTFTQEKVEIPVEMEIPNSIIQDGTTAISFELEMNKTILFPIGVSSTIDGENRIIKFDNVPIKNVGLNEVAKLKFIATLGNTEETTIRVRNIIPIGNDAEFDTTNGNFKLLGVCKEGGERFLSSSLNQTKLLSIAPNPATESIEIEYSNSDEGEAEIIISNLLGQIILTHKLEKTQTGKTKLDLSQFPTGQYSILFKTETVLENRVIQVIK